MKHTTTLPALLLALLLSGCAHKSPYDISSADAQKHSNKGEMKLELKGGGGGAKIPAGAKTTEKRFKKGEKMPDGMIAPEDVIFATHVKTYKKGDKLPDGTIAQGNLEQEMVTVRPIK